MQHEKCLRIYYIKYSTNKPRIGPAVLWFWGHIVKFELLYIRTTLVWSQRSINTLSVVALSYHAEENNVNSFVLSFFLHHCLNLNALISICIWKCNLFCRIKFTLKCKYTSMQLLFLKLNVIMAIQSSHFSLFFRLKC